MQSEIDENMIDLQYFYDKRRLAKKQIKRLKKTRKMLKNYQPRNFMRVCLQNEDISIIEKQIEAYLLRIKWCTLQIRQKNSNHFKLLNKLDEINKSMDLYFESKFEINALKVHELYEEAAWAAFFAIYFPVWYNSYSYYELPNMPDTQIKSKMNFEEMWDYSYELLEEISRLIAELPESNFITSNKFIDINNKLEKAKSLWINVSKYEEQIYNFRCSLLNRKISDKIQIIEERGSSDHSVFDISWIESNYLELKNDFSDIENTNIKFKELLGVIAKAKIWSMVEKYVSGESNAGFDFENIMRELQKAKDLWVDVHELEMMILGD